MNLEKIKQLAKERTRVRVKAGKMWGLVQLEKENSREPGYGSWNLLKNFEKELAALTAAEAKLTASLVKEVS